MHEIMDNHYHSSSPSTSSYIISTASNPLAAPYPSTLHYPSAILLSLPEPTLCDWTRNIYNCRDSDFTRTLLIVSTGIYIAAGSYGMWVLAYRNRGFNRRIVTSLFSYGNGLQPKPFDCLIFFASVAFMVKLPANLFLILDLLPSAWGYRIFLEQFHWILIAFSFTSFFVGLLYAMPITERRGIFAVYVPEGVPGSPPLSPIHILAPTPMQKNCMLVAGIIWPTVASFFGIVSGVLYGRNDFGGASFWFKVQYSTWVALLFSLSLCFYYYGFKYMFILRANIIIAEEALNTPRNSFGIGMLVSKSPARFLLATLHVTGIGGGSTTLLAGSMTIIWLVMKDYILSRPDERWGHIMSFLWTTNMAPAYFIIFVLTHGLSVRCRRRGIHDHHKSNRFSPEIQRKPRKTNGKEKEEGHDKDLEASIVNAPDQGTSFGLTGTTKRSSDGNHDSGKLARTTEPSRRDSATDRESESDGPTVKTVSLNPPPRPHKPGFRSTSIANLASNPSMLHESVFGGETRGMHHRSPSSDFGMPVSFFNLHAIPFGSRRYQSRPLPSRLLQLPPRSRNIGGDLMSSTSLDVEIRHSTRDQSFRQSTNKDSASMITFQGQEVDRETEDMDLTYEPVVIEMDDAQRQIEMNQQDSESWLSVPIVYK